MAIAIESLLFLLGGIVLALVLVKAFSRSTGNAGSRGTAGVPQVRLERAMRFPEGVEETRLVLNDQTILVASGVGVRLADYADEVEQLETIAIHMASALGVTVELARAPGKVVSPKKRLYRCVGCLAASRTGQHCKCVPAHRLCTDSGVSASVRLNVSSSPFRTTFRITS